MCNLGLNSSYTKILDGIEKKKKKEEYGLDSNSSFKSDGVDYATEYNEVDDY